jgi:acetate kinase
LLLTPYFSPKEREKIISADRSKAAVMVVPTNEELMIARETRRLIESSELGKKEFKKS